jgi:phage terminase large subunit-like protein
MPFDKKKALARIQFIQLLHLVDDFYGKPYVLPKWQYETIWDVYGTTDSRGFRQYQFAYLEVPKKNGKTTLIAGLGLSHLAQDPPGGQIYCCAADKDQAALTYQAALQMIDQDEDLQELFKITDSKRIITNRRTGTFMKVLSAEAYTKHGLNPTVVIFDELHAQPNRDLWDTMTFGSGAARKETLYWVITTAGDDPDHKTIGWEVHEYARKIRDGEKSDPHWYVRIYAAPEDADIFDEKVWYAANPSLGVTIDIENVRREALRAKNSASAEKLFRWLRLNQWVSLKSTSWLPLPLWDSTTGTLTKADLVGKRCYAGLDLSTVNDLTGLALLFPPQDGLDTWYFILWAFHPLENMKERVIKDKVTYDRWAQEGWLDATPGNVIDYTFIEAKIAQINQQYEVVAWGNDPRGAEKLRQDLLNEHDIELIEVPQDIKHLSGPMKEIERLSKMGEMKHEKNPLGRWTWGNVTVYVDGNGNYKPLKNKPVEKIDPMAALFNAMHLAMKLEQQGQDFIGIAVG